MTGLQATGLASGNCAVLRLSPLHRGWQTFSGYGRGIVLGLPNELRHSHLCIAKYTVALTYTMRNGGPLASVSIGMPKKDPVTGCTVMTPAEFWNAEAEAEGLGRTGGDLMHDFFDDLDKERAKTEDEFRKPDVAFDYIKDAVEEWNDADSEGAVPAPIRIVEVLDVQIKCGSRESGEMIKARAVRLDNGVEVEDVITVSSCTYYGGPMDPPDWDGNVQWDNYKQ